MANGKPGDHPFTAILSFGHSEFGEPVDRLVKEISLHAKFDAVRERVAVLLEELSPIGKPKESRTALIREAATRLECIKEQLRTAT